MSAQYLIQPDAIDLGDVRERLQAMSVGFSCLIWGVPIERVSVDLWVDRYIHEPAGIERTIEAILEF